MEKSSRTKAFLSLWLFNSSEEDVRGFLWDNNFMSHFEGHFERAKTFLTPYWDVMYTLRPSTSSQPSSTGT